MRWRSCLFHPFFCPSSYDRIAPQTLPLPFQAFKATAKGKGRLQNSIAGDIWLHCVAVVVLAATIAIGVWQLVAGAQPLSPLLISVRTSALV